MLSEFLKRVHTEPPQPQEVNAAETEPVPSTSKNTRQAAAQNKSKRDPPKAASNEPQSMLSMFLDAGKRLVSTDIDEQSVSSHTSTQKSCRTVQDIGEDAPLSNLRRPIVPDLDEDPVTETRTIYCKKLGLQLDANDLGNNFCHKFQFNFTHQCHFTQHVRAS